MNVYAEHTPNPLAIKFILGVPPVNEGYYLFSSVHEARGFPVLEDILALPGIESVLLAPDFITITKNGPVPWNLLESIILSALQHHISSFPLTIIQDHQPLSSSIWSDWTPPSPDIAELCQDIEDLIESRIRPAIEADGGIISFCGFQEGIVYVRLQGSCSSCPHSQETLKGGIEQTLTYYLPEVSSVELVE